MDTLELIVSLWLKDLTGGEIMYRVFVGIDISEDSSTEYAINAELRIPSSSDKNHLPVATLTSMNRP